MAILSLLSLTITTARRPLGSNPFKSYCLPFSTCPALHPLHLIRCPPSVVNQVCFVPPNCPAPQPPQGVHFWAVCLIVVAGGGDSSSPVCIGTRALMREWTKCYVASLLGVDVLSPPPVRSKHHRSKYTSRESCGLGTPCWEVFEGRRLEHFRPEWTEVAHNCCPRSWPHFQPNSATTRVKDVVIDS